MAEATGLSEKSVRRIWRKHGLKRYLTRTFKVSNDVQFAENLEAIVGLYLHQPEHAIVLCVRFRRSIVLGRGCPATKEGALRNGDPRLQAQRHGDALCRVEHSR
jgi:hypothetical protein